jgi:class 3 adenylate cyclase
MQGHDDTSLLARYHRGLDNLLEWSPAEKCLLVALIVLTFVLWYGWAEWYVLRHPEVAPYFDPVHVQRSFMVHLVELVVWPAIALLALWARKRAPHSRPLVHLTLQTFILTIVAFSYFLGLVTSLFAGLTVVGALTVGFILFETRAVAWALVTYMALFIVLMVAEQGHLILYAPMLAGTPHPNAHLSLWWLGTIGGPTMLIWILFMGWIYFLVMRWRDREERLAQTSDQLARANEVISRYVAKQLTQQIMAGNFELVDKHARRRLTLFFSDIEDFAETADHVEPEDLSEVLNEYLSEMARIGEHYGGTIDKFVGDAVMIFFGAPVATNDGDQAMRAVQMAIEMQKRLAELREKWLRSGFERPFHVRMGINTGRASIGNFGSEHRADYTAIGRQVNMAARLQSQCAPDRILISHTTWVLVQDEIACTPMGEITVKGFRDPVTVYEVIA